MSDTFSYRPKFVDIRVKKPDPANQTRAPKDRSCDHVGCERPGAHRAPKGRGRENEFWHFCAEHVAEYNKRWNYFAGMTDEELADFQKKEETGHRPTWTFRGGKGDRLAAAARGFQAGRRADPFGMFGSEAGQSTPRAPARRLTKLQAQALETLSLEENATAAEIRARYAEQVKALHPDSNGGDRGAEARLQKVVQAYQQLKAAGLV
ncbi:MAG: J domain-containing protein [Hyphomonadaceae bacterium]|nr:J domain-containing protein [Hyphomonadaceae bacterium]